MWVGKVWSLPLYQTAVPRCEYIEFVCEILEVKLLTILEGLCSLGLSCMGKTPLVSSCV